MQNMHRIEKYYYLDDWACKSYQTAPRRLEAMMQDTIMTELSDVRAGTTHPDPYPYYACLAANRPLFRDDEHGFWVAASAAAVNDVLTNELCWTRPAAARIPLQIQGGPMQEIFGRLVRLRDDDAGQVLKNAIIATLRSADLAHAAGAARACAAKLGAAIEPQRGGDRLTRFIFALPCAVMATLLGFPVAEFETIEAALKDYGAAAATAATGVPQPSADVMARGHAAASTLLSLTTGLLRETNTHATLLGAWIREARLARCDEADVVANTIGLLVQAHAATASLIGLALLALARRADLRAAVAADRKALRPLLNEVLRCDPATQSTIRFVARDGVVAGQAMREGDKIIVLLAAASLDLALNGDVPRFDIARHDRKSFAFGTGAHACPGDKLAPLIAEIAVDHLLSCGVALETLEQKLAYVASAHIRTPLFQG
jgi:cytochrome P450